MMVLKPSEANLRGTTTKYDSSKVADKKWSNFCFDQVETRAPQVEGAKLEAGEARRGPRRAKEGQTRAIYTKKRKLKVLKSQVRILLKYAFC